LRALKFTKVRSYSIWRSRWRRLIAYYLQDEWFSSGEIENASTKNINLPVCAISSQYFTLRYYLAMNCAWHACRQLVKTVTLAFWQHKPRTQQSVPVACNHSAISGYQRLTH